MKTDLELFFEEESKKGKRRLVMWTFIIVGVVVGVAYTMISIFSGVSGMLSNLFSG